MAHPWEGQLLCSDVWRGTKWKFLSLSFEFFNEDRKSVLFIKPIGQKKYIRIILKYCIENKPWLKIGSHYFSFLKHLL